MLGSCGSQAPAPLGVAIGALTHCMLPLSMVEFCQILLRGRLFRLSERNYQDGLTGLVHDLNHEGIPLMEG
jgi:hypothetical protein